MIRNMIFIISIKWESVVLKNHQKQAFPLRIKSVAFTCFIKLVFPALFQPPGSTVSAMVH